MFAPLGMRELLRRADRDRAAVSRTPRRAGATRRARVARPCRCGGRRADGVPRCPARPRTRHDPAQPARLARRDRAQRRPPPPATAPERGTARGVRSAGGVECARDPRGTRELAEGATRGRGVPGCARPFIRRDGGGDGQVGQRGDDALAPRPEAAPPDARCHGRRFRVVALAEAVRHAAGGGCEGHSRSRRRRRSRDHRCRGCAGDRSDRGGHGSCRAGDPLWKRDGGSRADAWQRARA